MPPWRRKPTRVDLKRRLPTIIFYTRRSRDAAGAVSQSHRSGTSPPRAAADGGCSAVRVRQFATLSPALPAVYRAWPMRSPRRPITLFAFGAAIAVVACGVLLFLTTQSRWRPSGDSSRGPLTGDLAPLWQVPPFSAVDQEGRVVTLDSLRGRPWIADFIFTRCTSVCPILTSKMVLVQREVTQPDVRFVSFSVDPAYDSPAVLREYAANWNADPRWTLLRIDSTKVREFSRAMRAVLERTDDPSNPIMHSSRFFLVDASGAVRGIYDSVDDAALHDLVSSVALLSQPAPAAGGSLARAATSASGEAEDGASLYASLGCAGCHENPRVAPSLRNLARRVGSGGDLAGTPVQEYVRQSILVPNSYVVPGYAAIMPSYDGHISQESLAHVVEYVSVRYADSDSLDSVAGPDVQPVAAVDPVCHMATIASKDTPQSIYERHTYYFCSEFCREAFAKAPARYVQRAATQPVAHR